MSRADTCTINSRKVTVKFVYQVADCIIVAILTSIMQWSASLEIFNIISVAQLRPYVLHQSKVTFVSCIVHRSMSVIILATNPATTLLDQVFCYIHVPCKAGTV